LVGYLTSAGIEDETWLLAKHVRFILFDALNDFGEDNKLSSIDH
jgi:hypothetical protein